jgi:hypothetical protein
VGGIGVCFAHLNFGHLILFETRDFDIRASCFAIFFTFHHSSFQFLNLFFRHLFPADGDITFHDIGIGGADFGKDGKGLKKEFQCGFTLVLD